MIPRIKHPITLSNLLKIKYNTQLFRRQKMLAPVLAFLFSCIYFSSTAQLRQVYIDNNEDNDLRKISFYNGSSGYVAFRDWIGYTTDSGRTFVKKYITLSNVNFNGYPANVTFGFGIKGVKAFNRDTVIAYGDYGLVPSILYSIDGAIVLSWFFIHNLILMF